jgi:WD40 repeat protein
LSGKILFNFYGHEGRIFTVFWSLLESNLIFTGSDDQTVRVWDIKQQTSNIPPADFSNIIIKKKKKKKSKKSNSEAISINIDEMKSPKITKSKTKIKKI